MRVHRGAWILPISSPPIRDGWIAVERDLIIAVGGPDERPSDRDSAAVPDVAILPGLVNAHTHLELSWMRGLVPPAASMPVWVQTLLALRRSRESDPQEPVLDAIAEVRASGTALVGDITNTLATYDLLAASDLSATVFLELIGFGVPEPARIVTDARDRTAALAASSRLRASLAPHAPYSVSPDLFRAIADVTGDRPISVHLAESREEVRFLSDGTGAWRTLLDALGAWNPAWQPPACAPVEYLDRLGILSPRLIAVHGVQLTDTELGRLAKVGATVVACPRSNRWTGAGSPPIDRFYASGVRVAIGTDSLASVNDLNLFHELAAVRRLAPDVAASRVLQSATLDGATALGFGAELGSLEAGKRAELLAVRVPATVTDVEEYLVGGIEPADVQWLERHAETER
jgi:cytosine/adenosine deaminase-related metal-dependent hydrolase